MRVEKPEASAFRAFELRLTFESQAEVDAFYALWNHAFFVEATDAEGAFEMARDCLKPSDDSCRIIHEAVKKRFKSL